ncbi:MAG: hypothetical protein ACRDEA_07615 [Microcystaceae cyanobacterium]
MMAYPVQTIEAQGIPRTEYRYEPDVVEIPIITIEFQPETHPLDDYGYFQPEFVFGDVVALKEQWEYCCAATALTQQSQGTEEVFDAHAYRHLLQVRLCLDEA